MKQIFRPRSNAVAKMVIWGGIASITAVAVVGDIVKWASYSTETEIAQPQPVPFSHKHHVGGLGIDCRYCHTTVEKSSYAGMPSTHTCMTCHSQIWQQAPMLSPVRDSYKNEAPLHWTRVYKLPNYVYFNHSIHVHKGVGCTSCHGKVNEMPLTVKVKSFYMRTCLECHRDPPRFLRPESEVFNPDYPGENKSEESRRRGLELAVKYRVPSVHRLTNCSICHR